MRHILAILFCLPVAAQLSFTVSDNGLSALSHNGTSRHADYPAYGGHRIGGVEYGYETPSRSVAGNTATWVFRSGQNGQVTFQHTYSATGDTLSIECSVTNNDTDEDLEWFFGNFGWTLSLPTILWPDLDTNIEVVNPYYMPVRIFHWAGGGVAMWSTDANAEFYAVGYPMRVVLPRSRTPDSPSWTLGPGQTKTFTVYLRFSSTEITNESVWAADIYEATRAVAPQIVNWADRRPLVALFVAEATKSSATNPRGYFSDDTLDALTPATFRSRMLSSVGSVLDYMDGLSVKPQGLAIWDIEGQEFSHAMTYIGDPRTLPWMAPEMDAVADEMMALVRNRGYKVGVTLRPTYFTSGTGAPSNPCAYSATYKATPKYIQWDGTARSRGFICQSGNAWSAGTNSIGEQVYYATLAEMRSELESKIDYAKRRWGVDFFYVDSNVAQNDWTVDSQLWRDALATYPDVLFAPEWDGMSTPGVAAPFRDQNSEQASATPQDYRDFYPNAFSWIQLLNATYSTAKRDAVAAGMAAGDLYVQYWYADGNTDQLVANAWPIAAATQSVLTLTDSAIAGTRTYTGSPRTAYKYPLVLRVAFKNGSSFDGSETTYCEKRDTVSCWAAGTKQSTATLDLASFTHVRREYRDFHGRLVSAGVAETK